MLVCIVDLGYSQLDFVYLITYHLGVDNWNLMLGLTHHSIQVSFGCQCWTNKCPFILFLEVRFYVPLQCCTLYYIYENQP